MSQPLKTVIVLPTYNEAQNVPLVFDQIAESLPGADVMVMDDNSPDGTADAAERLFESDSRFARYSVVRRTGPRGLGRSYRDGFRRAMDAGYDRIIQMDADLSHDPTHLPALLEASSTAGLVIGSRYCPGGGVRNWPASRVALSRFANWYVHKVAGIPVADATAGFRCWTRTALEAVDVDTLRSEGYSFQVEMSYRACRAGVRIAESPITFTDRLRARPWQPPAEFGSALVPNRALGPTRK
jgi:dolichol-phosphate mannosyltransferase